MVIPKRLLADFDGANPNTAVPCFVTKSRISKEKVRNHGWLRTFSGELLELT